jgi:hypothetical protein
LLELCMIIACTVFAISLCCSCCKSCYLYFNYYYIYYYNNVNDTNNKNSNTSNSTSKYGIVNDLYHTYDSSADVFAGTNTITNANFYGHNHYNHNGNTFNDIYKNKVTAIDDNSESTPVSLTATTPTVTHFEDIDLFNEDIFALQSSTYNVVGYTNTRRECHHHKTNNNNNRQKRSKKRLDRSKSWDWLGQSSSSSSRTTTRNQSLRRFSYH